jgi:hypothetical protein
MKKIVVVFLFAVMFFSLVTAKSIDIELPSGSEFSAGEPITFKATLYDDSGKPIDGEIQITIEDSEKRITNAVVSSKEVAVISLIESASSGQGVITAEAEGFSPAIAFFEVGREEQAKFEIVDGRLLVTNIGNTPYSKTIKITIGDTEGTQQTNLDIGETISYRLIAPDGEYNIRVTDGKTSLIQGGIRLTGTGNVIGAIDESTSQRSGITGGIGPDEGSDIAILSYLKNNSFIYVFVAVIFAGAILIAIERNYRKHTKK